MLKLDYELANNHYEIIRRKRHGGGAQLFRTLLLMFLTVAIVLTVADVFDRCYWPYRQMRPSIPLGTTASLGPAVQTLSRNFVVFPTDL